MTPERRREIEELYHLARERGPAVLANTEPELRREVETLLAQDSGGRIPDRQAAELSEEFAATQTVAGAELGWAGQTVPVMKTNGCRSIYSCRRTFIRTYSIRTALRQRHCGLHSPETHLQVIDSISRYSRVFLALWIRQSPGLGFYVVQPKAVHTIRLTRPWKPENVSSISGF
jgi:hypothetical protein